MAVGLVLQFANTSIDVYHKVNGLLGIDTSTGAGDWPTGLLSHAAGTSEDGSLVVIEVWESRGAQSKFMSGRLGAALGQGGITVVPQLTWVDLVAYQTPGKLAAT
jgi:hypothetical protein